MNRGMSWDAAVAFRDKQAAERAADGLPRSRDSGFYMNSKIANQAQTGARCSALPAPKGRRVTLAQRTSSDTWRHSNKPLIQ